MIRVAFGLFLFIHGFAHVVGFVVPWHIAALDQMPYRTTVLAGSIDVGDVGVRVVGIVWLGIALAFIGCGIGFLARQPWALSLTVWTALISLAMCVIGWPDARIGLFVNAAIIALLLLTPKEPFRSVPATRDEQTRPFPGDDLIAKPIGSLTHAITIRSSPHDVWPWIVQMGAGNRAGWYSYDFLDNGWQRSANHIVPALQNLRIGMIFPALPGATDGFTLVAFEPEHFLVLDWKAPDGGTLVTWAFVLEPLDHGFTRLIARARGAPGYHFRGLPRPVSKRIIRVVHFIMQRKQLVGIAERAEMLNRTVGSPTTAYEEVTVSHRSSFKTPEGKAAYLAAYDAAMKFWPASHEDLDIPSRFGITHVVVSGPEYAPPLVLLHGYMATLTMWSLNIADFNKEYRIYAIDVMGQPSRSIPDEPIRNTADYVEWLTATLDALHLDRVSLVGMSFGGWLALNYATVTPERVHKLVLLSPAASLLPLVTQFSMRGTSMMFFLTRFTVNSFMSWLTFQENLSDADTRRAFDTIVDLMYLGLKHVRLPKETLRVIPTVFSDDELRAMHVPTLLLMGEHEVIYDPAKALARARRLIPHVEGDLVPRSSHDMCFSQRRIVDARVLNFLKEIRTDDQGKMTERSVA